MQVDESLVKKWAAERERKAFLALADGTVFHGVGFGAKKDAVGEVVFNTGMSGYQEILTDPSYAGQFVTLTSPEIGNYGTNPEDVESRGLFLSGLIVHRMNPPSNWRFDRSLNEYLKAAGKPAIYGVDTRSLTIHLRDFGSQKAYLHVEDGEMDESEAIAKANAWEGLDGQDYAARVTCGEPYDFTLPDIGIAKDAPLVAAYDFGVKTNILRMLAKHGFRVRVFPAKTPYDEILKIKPDGVFLSNGPADPAAVKYAQDNIRSLVGKVPIMGICLGHQLLSIACGAQTGRLAFGHHGCNHPVKNMLTGHVEITSQNHNFAVMKDTVPSSLEVTHVNLNDGTIEGVRHRTEPAFSVQYHPEAAPGPNDAAYLFKQFRDMIGR